MKLNEALVKAVSTKDILAIRDSLWTCIAIDSAFTEYFQANYNYCMNNGITEEMLFQPHDGTSLSLETTEDNFARLCGDLKVNFSKERMAKIREMGRILYPPKKTTDQTESQNSHRTSTSSVSGTHSRLKEEPKKESASQMGSIIVISAIIVIVVVILALIMR